MAVPPLLFLNAGFSGWLAVSHSYLCYVNFFSFSSTKISEAQAVISRL
jgi:hypothetical protein